MANLGVVRVVAVLKCLLVHASLDAALPQRALLHAVELRHHPGLRAIATHALTPGVVRRGAPGQREGTADSPSQETHAQRPNVHTHMRARTHAVHTRHHIDTHTTPTTSHTLLFTGPTHRRSDDELDDGRFRVVLVIAHLERVGGDPLRDLSRSKPHQRKKRGQFAGPHKDANQSGGGMRQNTCSSSCPWRPPTACLRSALCFRLASSAPSATVGSRAGALAGAASRRTIMSQSAVLVSSWDRPIRAQSAVTLSPCVC